MIVEKLETEATSGRDTKVDNNKIRKAFFVNLRPLYVTDMCYLEPDVSVSFYL